MKNRTSKRILTRAILANTGLKARVSTLRADPTRTSMMQQQFCRLLDRQFDRLVADVMKAVGKENWLGVEPVENANKLCPRCGTASKDGVWQCGCWDNKTVHNTYQPFVCNGSIGYFPFNAEQGLIEVPDVRQPDHTSCGAAAAMSVGKWFGVGPDTIEQWKVDLNTSDEGTHPEPIVRYLRHLGLQVEAFQHGNLAILDTYLAKGWPIICCVQDYGPRHSWEHGHYLIVIGHKDGYIFAQDPAMDNVMTDGHWKPIGELGSLHVPGRVMIPEEEFVTAWHDEDEHGKPYVRFGIAVGPKITVNTGPEDEPRDATGRWTISGGKEIRRRAAGGRTISLREYSSNYGPVVDLSFAFPSLPSGEWDDRNQVMRGGIQEGSLTLWREILTELRKLAEDGKNITYVTSPSMAQAYRRLLIKEGWVLRHTEGDDNITEDIWSPPRTTVNVDWQKTTCSGKPACQYPGVRLRNGSGHEGECAVHKAYLKAKGYVENCQPGQLREAGGKCGPGIGVSIPREEMPQILKWDLEAFVEFANGRGIGVAKGEASADSLSPTQAEFRQERVDALPDGALEQSLLISEDDYILDGIHRWVKAWQKGQDTVVKVYRILLPLHQALALMRSFPGVKYVQNAHMVEVRARMRRLNIGKPIASDLEWVENTRWQFHSSSQKLAAFGRWIRGRMHALITGGPMREAWRKYVEAGWRRGAARAFDDANRTKRALQPDTTTDFYRGGKEQFLERSFNHPESVEKVKLLASRVYTELNGVTEAMSTHMGRTLTDGLTMGQHPYQIATTMVRDVNKIGRARARLIARTELSRGHAESQLDNLEMMGVTHVGAAVEWMTSRLGTTAKGNLSPCNLCAPLEGLVLTIREARGLLPRHPGCMCAWGPANVGEYGGDQLSTKDEIEAAFDESGIEDVQVGGKRPKSIFGL